MHKWSLESIRGGGPIPRLRLGIREDMKSIPLCISTSKDFSKLHSFTKPDL